AGARPGGPGGGIGQGGARPGGPPGAGAGARPGAGGNFAGGRPTAGQLSNFLDIPGPATGAIGAGGAGRPGGAAADFLQQGAASQRPALGTALGGAAVGAGIAGIASQLPAGGANRPNLGAGQIGNGQIGAGNRPANPIAGTGRLGADL